MNLHGHIFTYRCDNDMYSVQYDRHSNNSFISRRRHLDIRIVKLQNMSYLQMAFKQN